MTDHNIELSRRKILASVGAIGAAGAGAGVGTSALFNDTESFEGNSITAGELDLKVDWEEHYSFPQIYGLGDPTTAEGDGETVDLNVRRTEPSDPSNYTGLPDPTDPVVWVHDDDFDQYFQNTTIEAFPDSEGGPIAADFDNEQPCEVLADVPDDFGAYADDVDGPARTRNEDTYDSENDEPLPLISLNDVKPGDFGELTLSTHLCFNDGYLWMQMPGGLDNDENSVTEPEAEAENESLEELENPNTEVDQDGDINGDGELAQNVRTALWYDDDCSNTIDGEPEPVIAMALIDTSNSIESSDMETIADASDEFVEQLNANAETDVAAGVMTFSDDDQNPGEGNPSIVLQNDVERLEPGSAYLTDPASGDPEGKFEAGSNLLPEQGNGGTPLAPALDLARELLNDRAQTLIDDPSNGFGPNTRKTILLISDGLPTTPNFDRYQLVNPSGGKITAQNGTGVTNAPDGQFLSDVFDGTVDGNTTTTSIRDEAALVARDIDTGGKTDTGPSGTTDDPDISGEDGITLRTVAIGSESVSELNDFMTRLATGDLWYNSAISDDLIDLVEDIVKDLNVTGPAEEVIFRGTLEQLADELDPDENGPLPLDGMPMGSEFDELNGDDGDPARDSFDASATHCFGLAWWVPEEVGNEIQTDSVSFDLGFYAEQARNNENPGQSFGNS